jgi:lysophospholipase L1-like esterase
MSEGKLELKWTDALDIGVEGRGWKDTLSPYDRLPGKARGVVPQAVWDLGRSATGMCVHFRTDARQIHARWRLQDAALGEDNFSVCGFSGLDLYGDDRGVLRWVGTGRNVEGQDPEVCVVDGLDGVERAYRLYLPLRNPVLELEIGVPAQAAFSGIPPRGDLPLVVYGTSIVHGAYASRPGLLYTAILGRRLDVPVINLGFSGSAKMEIELAELLAELDARAYVVDALPNMDLNLVNERTEAFVRRLRALRPQTPIVLVEDFPRTNCWIKPALRKAEEEKCRRFREIFEGLVGEGLGGLHYVEGRALLGTDHEGTLDGCHPNDVGYMRMADAMEPVLRPLCRT